MFFRRSYLRPVSFTMGPEKNSCNFLRGNLSKQPMKQMDENMLLYVPIKTINPFLAVLKIGWDNSLFISYYSVKRYFWVSSYESIILVC